jgi:predicted patatin/cPLA2 family phospholipase
LVASCSIPLISRAAAVGERLYFDGGVSDSLPIRYALSKHKKAVVVLTRPRGYRKGRLSNSGLLKFVFRKHPDFLKTLLRRNEDYNETLDFCEEMERQGKLFLIIPGPEFSIGRTEKSLEKRMALYEHGYSVMRSKLEEMKNFLDYSVTEV